MKKIILTSLLFLPSLLFADTCELAAGAPGLGNTFYGNTNCGPGSVDTIQVNGDLDVLGTVIGTASVSGEMDATSATINTLIIKGILHATNSHFGTISAGNSVYLDDSNAKEITISSSFAVAAPKVYLNDQTTVGNITFQGGNGLVIVEADSAVIQGSVTGGHVQYQNNDL